MLKKRLLYFIVWIEKKDDDDDDDKRKTNERRIDMTNELVLLNEWMQKKIEEKNEYIEANYVL